MKTVKLSSIKPNELNPRRITEDAFTKLCESIKRDPQFMSLRPIVVDDDDVIIGGNQRYLACVKLGMEDVPANWIIRAKDFTPEQRKRFVIVDNAPEGMAGYWDFDMLEKLEWTQEDLSDMGFMFPELPNFEEEWSGMPPVGTEIDSNVRYRKLNIWFRSAADVDAFSKLIGQELTATTVSIWYPMHEKRDMKGKAFKSES